MYAAQYGDLQLAGATLKEIPKGQSIDRCASCDECTITCSHAVDIPKKIAELKAMYA